MVDVGAVAARSGPPVEAADEIERLIPAVAGLATGTDAPISADTFEPAVAIAAAAAGAAVINDIGGGPDRMLEAIAETGCGYVLMHIEGAPRVDRPAPSYDDVVERLKGFFAERIERAIALGVDERAIAIDPGLDFDLTMDDDVEILQRLEELHSLGRPLYVSLSRKDFIGAILAGSWERRLPATERGNGTIAAAALAAGKGAQVHRLHDHEALDAIRVAGRIARMHRLAPASLPAEDLPWGSAIDEAWRAAIDPGRADGRLVAESAEREQEANEVPLPAQLDPGLRAALERSGVRHPLRPPARGTAVRRDRERGRHQRHRVGQVAGVQHAGARRDRPGPEGAGLLPLPDQGAGPGSGPQADRDRARRAAPGDLRRGHAARGTPGDQRRSNLILTNPDMLHVGVLPHHRNWGDFFANLRYVVVDEAHVYRGVFGSHVANVLRRLRRVAALYGSEPRFILTSATIANPLELAERLVGTAVPPRRLRRRPEGRAEDRDLEPAPDRPAPPAPAARHSRRPPTCSPTC